MSMYGIEGEWDALTALCEFGSGKSLSDDDKAKMFANGFMDDEFKPTKAGRQALMNRQTEAEALFIGGTGAGLYSETGNDAEFGADPHLSEVVNLGHGAGVLPPRFTPYKEVPYTLSEGSDTEQMQGSIPRHIDCGMDTIPSRKERTPQAS
jgi:hypothetical protein